MSNTFMLNPVNASTPPLIGWDPDEELPELFDPPLCPLAGTVEATVVVVAVEGTLEVVVVERGMVVVVDPGTVVVVVV